MNNMPNMIIIKNENMKHETCLMILKYVLMILKKYF